MDIQAWLDQATTALTSAGIPTPRLDCLVLLEDCLNIDRAHLLAHPDTELSDEQIDLLTDQIERRREHEPLAYIRNRSEFYGREFYVDHRVLEPRPESETMIEVLKSLHPSDGSIITDIGTGSGMLAITTKLELPHSDIYASDIDENCLVVARKNAKAHHADIVFRNGDLLEPLNDIDGDWFAILANLPYVPDNFQINPAAMREPRIAIFGGADGLDVYRKLFMQLSRLSNKPRYLLTEALPPQHKHVAHLARTHGYAQERHEDFIQLFERMD